MDIYSFDRSFTSFSRKHLFILLHLHLLSFCESTGSHLFIRSLPRPESRRIDIKSVRIFLSLTFVGIERSACAVCWFSSMASFTFGLVLLFFIMISVAGRARPRDYRIRALWGDLKHKMKETAVDRFHLDLRRFDREDMLLFPDVAFQSMDSNGPWTVVVHGWRFEGSKRKDWLGFSTSKWVERLAHEILSPNQVAYLNGSINRDRLKPFFVEDESKEVVLIQLGDQTHHVKTNSYGQFYEELKISNDQMKQLKAQQQRTKTITYQAVGDNQDTSTGLAHLIEPREGISVISDIDDTIKISEVLDKVRLLANTFIHDFKVVPGKCR